jgi:multicomponent Na+:H+ antiporter subunit D
VNPFIPLLIPLISFITAGLTAALRDDSRRFRIGLQLGTGMVQMGLVIYLLAGVYNSEQFMFRLSLFMGFDLLLHADALSLLFITLSSSLWLVTSVYAVGYAAKAGLSNQSRFFGFYSACVGATTGLALAGNLFTFLFFYELLTLVTWPLIVHHATPESFEAGRKYLRYSLGGGTMLLFAMIWLHTLAGPLDFVAKGFVHPLVGDSRLTLQIIFMMMVTGFGVKAAIFPLHGWLPNAMVAPAPVSALLHAVAVVKAGAFGIVRLVYDVFGASQVTALGLRPVVISLAAFTIIYGSIRALRQDDIKARLAWSTVSQLSYVTIGVALAPPMATIGGIVHIVHQGVMKITMFFCAGNLAEELHIKKVSMLDGSGWRMPGTMGAFTIAACGMIGLPPMAGFISKYYLCFGALEAGKPWLLAVLMGSSLLNAGYFLPIIYRAWFKESGPSVSWDKPSGYFETDISMLLPPLITAAAVLIFGILAGLEFSPLAWARLITAREYMP